MPVSRFSSPGRQALLALLTSVLLVAGVVSPVAAAEVEGPPPSPMDVPVTPSEPLAPVELDEPVGDFSDDLLEPVDTGRGQVYHPRAPDLETVDPSTLDEPVEQSEYSNTYDYGDGLMMTELAPEPINVKVDGEWEDVETTVEFDWLDGLNRPGFDGGSLSPRG